MPARPDHLFIGCAGDMFDTRKPEWSKNTPLRARFDYVFRQPANTAELRASLRTRYAFPGGYEIFAITSDGALLCNDCCKKEYRQLSAAMRDHDIRGGWHIAAFDIAASLEGFEACDHCGYVLCDDENEDAE